MCLSIYAVRFRFKSPNLSLTGISVASLRQPFCWPIVISLPCFPWDISANQPSKQRKAKHATNLFCSKMFLSCRARRNYENYRFVWHVLVSRAIFENYSNYMVSMWSCSVWIPQPTDLWEQQKICKSHANMYIVFYAFLLRITSASDLWELQYFHIFLHRISLYFLRFPVQHWFPAILENCSPTELQCFHVFLLSFVSSNGLWEIQWFNNIFWTSLIFPLRKTVTRVLYRMISGYHFAHKLTS